MKTDLKPNTWLYAGLLSVVLFGAIWFTNLSQRPMHNDESVNAMFVYNLVKFHKYNYDPTNFHGPVLYYIEWVFTRVAALWEDGREFHWKSISGLGEASLRAPVVIGGLLVLLCCLALVRRIGRWGSLTAVLLLGLSSNFAYFTRYFIHEIFLVLFTLTTYASVSFYLQTKKPIYLYGLMSSLALIFCTKETSVVHYFILGFSVVCTGVVWILLGGKQWKPTVRRFIDDILKVFYRHGWHVLNALLLGLFIYGAFYTHFFTYLEGIQDSVATYKSWGPRGISSGHAKSFYYFIEEGLFKYELALLMLSFIGMVIAFMRNDKTGLYLSFWTLGTVGAYSVIPYKTPWCVVNLLLPMGLLSGYGVHSFFEGVAQSTIPHKKRITGVVMGAVVFLMILQAPKMWRLLFWEYDNPKHTQVYQHTDRDIYSLLDQIKVYADKSGEGMNVKINIVSKETWPLPYYLRSYNNVRWGMENNQTILESPLLIVNKKQERKVDKILKTKYHKTTYTFRQSVQMTVYVHPNLVDSRERVFDDLPVVFNSVDMNGKEDWGLKQEVFRGIRFMGDPLRVNYGTDLKAFYWEGHKKPYESPFSIRWTGYLKVEKEGEHTFYAESDDGSYVVLDDYLIVDNGGFHEPRRVSKSVNLKPGFHRFEVKYYDWVGEAVFRLYWKQPGESEEEIPFSNLVHVK